MLASLVTACSDDDKPPPLAAELLAPGPHAVGFRETELSYDPVGDEDTRTLTVRVWYPAVDSGEDDAIYRVAGIVEQLAGAPMILVVVLHQEDPDAGAVAGWE